MIGNCDVVHYIEIIYIKKKKIKVNVCVIVYSLVVGNCTIINISKCSLGGHESSTCLKQSARETFQVTTWDYAQEVVGSILSRRAHDHIQFSEVNFVAFSAQYCSVSQRNAEKVSSENCIHMHLN